MDIQLPIIDGSTATRKIKADPAMRSIPIIAGTSYVLSGEEKKAREAGCDGYVPKPFSRRQLLAKIRQYLPRFYAAACALPNTVARDPRSPMVGKRAGEWGLISEKNDARLLVL